MAVLNFVGWETGYQDNALAFLGEANTAGTGAAVLSSSIKRSGSYSLRCNPTTTAVGFATISGLPANGGNPVDWNEATVYARFYFRADTLPATDSEEICIFGSTAISLKMALRITSAGNLQVYGSDGTTQLGSDGATTLSPGVWYRIEAKCGTGASGAYEVRIEGATELSGTGNLTVSNNAYFIVGKVTNRNGKSVDFYYDDILISNSDWAGPGRCLIMVPDGDGAYTAWTIGAGSGDDWQQVDEVPNDGATTHLLSTFVIGEASTVTLQSATAAGIAGTVVSVKPILIHTRGTLNATPSMRFRSNTTDVDSGFIIQGNNSYNIAAAIFDTDPATSAAWQLSALNSVEVGMVSGHASRYTVWTAGYVMVEYIPIGQTYGTIVG